MKAIIIFCLVSIAICEVVEFNIKTKKLYSKSRLELTYETTSRNLQVEHFPTKTYPENNSTIYWRANMTKDTYYFASIKMETKSNPFKTALLVYVFVGIPILFALSTLSMLSYFKLVK